MLHLKYRILILLILPVLFINLSANALFSIAHSMQDSGNSSAHKVSIFDTESKDHCPACPSENNQKADHSHNNCEHHSPVFCSYPPLSILYSPNITTHRIADPFNALPEVYLDRFIPPETFA